jgi:hypothetical protein
MIDLRGGSRCWRGVARATHDLSLRNVKIFLLVFSDVTGSPHVTQNDVE